MMKRQVFTQHRNVYRSTSKIRKQEWQQHNDAARRRPITWQPNPKRSEPWIAKKQTSEIFFGGRFITFTLIFVLWHVFRHVSDIVTLVIHATWLNESSFFCLSLLFFGGPRLKKNATERAVQRDARTHACTIWFRRGREKVRRRQLFGYLRFRNTNSFFFTKLFWAFLFPTHKKAQVYFPWIYQSRRWLLILHVPASLAFLILKTMTCLCLWKRIENTYFWFNFFLFVAAVSRKILSWKINLFRHESVSYSAAKC